MTRTAQSSNSLICIGPIPVHGAVQTIVKSGPQPTSNTRPFGKPVKSVTNLGIPPK
jgi:hypothetical protein